MTPFKIGLRSKIVLVVLGAMVLAMSITASAFGILYARQQSAAIQSRSQAIAKSLALQLDRIVALGVPLTDLQGFDEQCREAMNSYEGLSYAMVINRDNQILFHNDPNLIGQTLKTVRLREARDGDSSVVAQSSDGNLVATAPVYTLEGFAAARVLVGYPRALLDKERNTLLMISVGFGCLVIALCLILLYLSLSQYVLSPIQRFIDTAENIRNGSASYEVRLPMHGEAELDTMMEAFNRLLDEIAQRERCNLIAAEAANEANKAKSEFLAVMSHEIRTPIHAILGMTELLQGTTLTEKQKRYLTRIYDASGMLLNIVNEVLDFSKIESGELKILQVPFNLAQIVSDKVEIFSEMARKKNLALVLMLNENLPETVIGDPYRLGQIINNLVSNAIKFSSEGRIDVSLSAAGDRVQITVQDMGAGIDPHFLPKIFEPFQQADSSASRPHGGTGLGLAIVRQLSEAMGGHVFADSVPGEGSTFHVELPLPAVPHAADATIGDGDENPAG